MSRWGLAAFIKAKSGSSPCPAQAQESPLKAIAFPSFNLQAAVTEIFPKMGRLACSLALWTVALLSASVAAQSTIPLVKRTNPAVISAKLHAGPSKAIPALHARDTVGSSALKDNVGIPLSSDIVLI